MRVLWAARPVGLGGVRLEPTEIDLTHGQVMNPGERCGFWVSGDWFPDLTPGTCRRVTLTLEPEVSHD